MLTIEGRSVVKGGRVTYVPFKAKGDKKHEGCLDGYITSFDSNFVYVNCDQPGDKKPLGVMACHVKNLVWWSA